MGENVENIKSSLDTQLNFMFSTYSPIFCCLSTRGPDVSHPSLRFLYIFGNPGLLCATTVIWLRPQPANASKKSILVLEKRNKDYITLDFVEMFGGEW